MASENLCFAEAVPDCVQAHAGACEKNVHKSIIIGQVSVKVEPKMEISLSLHASELM